MKKYVEVSDYFQSRKDVFDYVKLLGVLQYVGKSQSALSAYHATGDEKYLEDYNFYKYIIEGTTNLNITYVTDCCMSVFHNKGKIIDRVKGRIEEMLSEVDDIYQTYFITLTMNNEFFKWCRENDKTLQDIRSYVRIFLHEYAVKYVANKDFGERADRTHRLHFHGCILMDRSKVNRFIINYNKKFGFCKLEVVDKKSLCLSRYITKLTYHFLKDSTHRVARENLIYSR